MDFIDQLKQFSKKVETIKDGLLTEEATKMSIIVPFESIKVEFNEPTIVYTKKHDKKYTIAAMLNCCQYGRYIGKSKDDYPRYLFYEYNIDDPIAFQKELIDDGYLVKGDIESSLNKLKVVQLKEILKSNQLSDKGKKTELIERIIKNINYGTLELEPVYILSEKGQNYLEKYNYIFDLKKYNISIEEFDTFKFYCQRNLKLNEVMFQILNQKYKAYNASYSYGLARNQLFYISKLLNSQERYTDSLFYLIIVLYYDVSGLSNNNNLDPIEDIFLAPGIIACIYKLKEFYKDGLVEKCYSDYKLPHCYLDIYGFKKILTDMFNGDYNNQTKIALINCI